MLLARGNSQSQDGEEMMGKFRVMLDHMVFIQIEKINVSLFCHDHLGSAIFTENRPTTWNNIDSWNRVAYYLTTSYIKSRHQVYLEYHKTF